MVEVSDMQPANNTADAIKVIPERNILSLTWKRLRIRTVRAQQACPERRGLEPYPVKADSHVVTA